MSYLLDKKEKRKKIINAVLCIIFLILFFYFRNSVSKGFSYVSQGIFRPFLVIGNGTKQKWNGTIAYFESKRNLDRENQNLRTKLAEQEAKMTDYNFLSQELSDLQSTMGRKNEKANFILAAILSKPNKSPYDTLLIDAGENLNIKSGDLVLAKGDVPIGRIGEVYPSLSKVILFSNPKEKTQVVVSGKNTTMEIVGRGGGNFEMILPRDFNLQKGETVNLLGIFPYTVAVAETVISDPRDAYTKALLKSPVNIQELNFVEIVK